MMMLGLYSGVPSAGGVLLLDCSAFARACVVSTDVHGFERLTAPLGRALADAFRFYDQAGMLYVGLVDGSQIVWEGRLEDPTLVAGSGGSGLTIQALGSWRALSDDRYTALWSTTSVADFIQTTSVHSTAYSESERWGRDTNNRLYIELVKGTTYTLNKASGLLYFAPHLGARQIVAMQFQVAITLPTTMTMRIVGFDNSSPPGGALTNGIVFAQFVGTGALVNRAYSLNLTGNPRDIVGIDILCNTGATPAGETGANNITVTKLRVATSITNRVDTTLTANRNAGTNVTATVASTAGMYVGMELVMNSGATSSEVVTVLSIGSSTQFNADFVFNYTSGQTVRGLRILADEIVEDILDQVATLNSAQLSSSTALIQSPGLDLLDEVYEDAVIGDILTRLAGLGDNQATPRQWEVGVYEDRTLFFRPQGSASRAWYVDATDLSVVRTLEDLANSVYAVYQDPNGATLRTAITSDSVSVARYGVTRRAAISADTTSATQAGTERDAYLQDHKDPLPRATIRFDAVYDAAGARYPLWLVRSGDTMTIRNLPPNISTSVDRIRTFRITHTSYDAFADTLDVEPEAAPRTLEVMLARRGEGIRD